MSKQLSIGDKVIHSTNVRNDNDTPFVYQGKVVKLYESSCDIKLTNEKGKTYIKKCRNDSLQKVREE